MISGRPTLVYENYPTNSMLLLSNQMNMPRLSFIGLGATLTERPAYGITEEATPR